ncbi:MAG: CATRA system-associated protein [Acidimicrobiales bacterium]
MTPLRPDDIAVLDRALAQVHQAHLRPEEWHDVDAALADLGSALDRGDLDQVHRERVRLANAGFRSHIRGRMGSAGTHSPAVAPTKRTPALPAVGAVCAAVLMALGWALGGGLLLAATIALGLFVLGIAVAGSRSFNERRAAGRGRTRSVEATVPIPAGTSQAVTALRARLDAGG